MPTPASLSPMPWSHRPSSYHQADAEGRFRVPMAAGAHRSLRGPGPVARRRAVPARRSKQGEWPKGAVEQSVDLALPRGVVVRGKITEEGTGRPVAGSGRARHVVPRSPGLLGSASPG